MCPRCASISRLAVGNPRPDPRALVVKNGVKIFSCISEGMPGPLSLNAIRQVSSIDASVTRIVPSSLHRLCAIDQ